MNVVDVRIIPARAGFTTRTCASSSRSRDHPRSRGVYTLGGTHWAYLSGSSPLARGLHKAVVLDSLTARIIPARAGFTRRPAASRFRTWDHPRSRGVYPGSARRQRRGTGSSPLARGLHRFARREGHAVRIIPARAGFTGCTPGRHGRGPDHPRSRGVYLGEGEAAVRQAGSSPLARGLPHLARGDLVPVRIIPARAGFTPRPRSLR